jgi:hypothetical protein
MPQLNYTHRALMLGQIATTENYDADSYINELLAQESEVTVGGAAIAGTYTIQIDGPDANSITVDFVAAGGEAPAVVVAGFLAAVQADSDFTNLLVATDASPILELDFIHPGQVYVISFPSDPNGILSGALIQAAGGTNIHLGVGVVPGSAAQLAVAPGAATVDADFLGITFMGTVEIMVNDGLSTSLDVFAPGCSVSVMSEGTTVVGVEDAVAFNGPVFMRTQNPGPGQHLGGFRSDADGGNAIAIAGARFRSATTGVGLAQIKVNRP